MHGRRILAFEVEAEVEIDDEGDFARAEERLAGRRPPPRHRFST
jgi:hypothetical protein